MEVLFWLWVLSVAVRDGSAQVFTEPDLAAILNDPAADGYDRTFSKCEVEAEDFQATVTSTAYRVLKGVCNPTELEDHLAAMEDRLNKRLEQMTQTLLKQLRGHSSGSNADSSTPGGRHSKPVYIDNSAVDSSEQSELRKQQLTAPASYAGLQGSHAPQSSPQSGYHHTGTGTSAPAERRLAVQRLLPKPSQPSTAAAAKVQPTEQAWPQSQNIQPATDHSGLLPTAQRQVLGKRKSRKNGKIHDWNSIRHNRMNKQQEQSQYIGKSIFRGFNTSKGKLSMSNSAELPSATTRWQTSQPSSHHHGSGGGKHVTDTISSVSDRRSAAQSRYSELSSYNDTVYHMNGRKMYSYYWQIEDMPGKMASFRPSQHIQSPRFYVFHGGYRMSMRLFPNRSGGSVLIRAGLAPGRNDARLRWPFNLPFRLTLLDHSRRPRDIQSRTWRPQQEPCPTSTWRRLAGHQRDNRFTPRRPHQQGGHHCLGLSVPHTLLTKRRTLLNGALLVKMDVFLDDMASSRLT